ncbi:MAG: DMT family transporter [archaeon]
MKFFKKHKTAIADLGLLYSAAIWGSTFFIVKNSLDSIDPIVLVGYRFMLAAIILGVYLAAKKHNLFDKWKQGFILGFVLWLLYASQTIGLKFTTASNSGFITGLFVVFVPFIGLFFKIRPTKHKIISVFIAITGLWLLTGGLYDINFGDMLTLIAALTYAIHILLADKYVKNCHPLVLSFQQFFTMGLLSFASAILFGLPFSVQSSGTVGIIIFLALFPSLSAFAIQLVAQKFTSPIKVALIFTMEPVFAAVFAWTLGKEEFIMLRALGGLLIVAAMIISEVK